MDRISRAGVFGLLGVLFNLFSIQAFSQIVYFHTLKSELVRYNLDTQEFKIIGITEYNGKNIVFVDLASNYQGEVYGVAVDSMHEKSSLYKVDLNTAQATKVGSFFTMSWGLTFTPDGKLYGVGPADHTNNFFEINPVTATYKILKKLPIHPDPDDIAWNPVEEKFYYASQSSPYRLLDLDNFDEFADFGVMHVFGFDFVGDGERAFGIAGNTVYNMDKVGQRWETTSTVTGTEVGRCWGATKYHCTSITPKVLVNGAEEKIVEVNCGDDLLLTGKNEQIPAYYRWTISGKDLEGNLKELVIEDVGVPEEVDLVNDPRLSELKVNHATDQPRHFTASLQTWCDRYEKPSPMTTVEFVIGAISQNWTITPDSVQPMSSNPNEAIAAYYMNTETQFLDLGSEGLSSQRWFIDGVEKGSSNPYPFLWGDSQVGVHLIEHEVLHQNRCVTREARKLEILPYRVFVPDAFTPNGDGLNDSIGPSFHPVDPVEVEFLVFNRFGENVFKGSGMQARWDGRYKGQLAELSTYVYMLRYRMPGGTLQIAKGNITLVR